jgi:hypothetical protein
MSSLDLHKLGAVPVLDLDGKALPLVEATGRRLVVLAFLRHFG